jgi:hypothetical protein
VTVPRRADGARYQYEMIHGGGFRRAYSDDPVLLVAELVDGYDHLDETARQAARIGHARAVRPAAQARIVFALGTDGCNPEQVDALLTADPSQVREWSAPVPLLLVDADFPPSGPRPVAVDDGRLLWLATVDELSYLLSLNACGEIVLSRTSGAA